MPNDRRESVGGLIKKTDQLLWVCYHAAKSGGPVTATANRLVFPKFADGVVRVSEQEAKQSLIDLLPGSPFFYSVETPTSGNYSFTGDGERSAATDLTLYTDTGERYLNFEFKAHGFSLKRRNVVKITKDLKKLVLEPVNGFWFHTFKTVDSKTIPNLWSLLRRELKDITSNVVEQFATKSLSFHCCVLQQKFSLETTISLNPETCGERWLDDVNPPAFTVRKGSLENILHAVGWAVHRPEAEPATVQIEGR